MCHLLAHRTPPLLLCVPGLQPGTFWWTSTCLPLPYSVGPSPELSCHFTHTAHPPVPSLPTGTFLPHTLPYPTCSAYHLAPPRTSLYMPTSLLPPYLPVVLQGLYRCGLAFFPLPCLRLGLHLPLPATYSLYLPILPFTPPFPHHGTLVVDCEFACLPHAWAVPMPLLLGLPHPLCHPSNGLPFTTHLVYCSETLPALCLQKFSTLPFTCPYGTVGDIATHVGVVVVGCYIGTLQRKVPPHTHTTFPPEGLHSFSLGTLETTQHAWPSVFAITLPPTILPDPLPYFPDLTGTGHTICLRLYCARQHGEISRTPQDSPQFSLPLTLPSLPQEEGKFEPEDIYFAPCALYLPGGNCAITCIVCLPLAGRLAPLYFTHFPSLPF